MPVCEFCTRTFSTWNDVQKHKRLAPECKKKVEAERSALLNRLRADRRAKDSGIQQFEGEDSIMDMMDEPSLELMDVDPVPNAALDVPREMENPDDCDAVTPPRSQSTAGTPSRRRTWGTESQRGGGATYGPGRTQFDEILNSDVLKDGEVLGPFKDEAEWELAKWLIKHVGHTATEEFLKLPIISERANPSYPNKKSFFEKIDDLPAGVKWEREEMNITGDLPDLEKDPTGETMRGETLDLWWRDPVECVRELIGNPMLREGMQFAPTELYADDRGETRLINEMWTGDWWNEMEQRLPPNSTIAPLILSSDKTLLTNFRGDQSAWPVYLSIGNIPKETRRTVTAHATVLVGYLPVPKFDCFDKDTRSLAKYRLFHRCMRHLLASIKAAGTRGVYMACADNLRRLVFPILAVYVADYPEQCLVACCKENRCPLCYVGPNERGDHTPHAKRDEGETLFFMQRQKEGQKDTAFDEHGLRAVYPPFWADLPHSDIFQAFTPDLLHQLHKGVFKDHVVKWCQEIIGKVEIDERFRRMPDHPGIRHFKNGISSVSQWTGSEHKEMEKVFLGLVAAGAHSELVKAVRALMDFISLASLQSHTSATLLALRTALDDFHTHKNIFIELGGRKDHFNFPKLHSLEHYEPGFRLFGSSDGFNTELPERLHIDYAKNAYRASNHKDYIIQMTLWLQRQEAVARFSAFREWHAASARADAITTASPLPLPPAPPVSRALPSASTKDDAHTLIHHSYKISKHPPAATRAVLVSRIIAADGHNASRFIPALSTFLRSFHNTVFPAYEFDVVPTWKCIKFVLPEIPEIGQRHAANLVRATAPGDLDEEPNYRDTEPAHHDFALVRTAESNTFTEGTALQGLRVAQVRAIFQLPKHFPVKTGTPLAYVEWFTPFRTPNSLDGYYHVNRSTRKLSRVDGPYAEIVTVDRIARNVMLIPRTFGDDSKYRVNSHSDGHSFCTFKLNYMNCLPV